ncbi:MAG: hypothetical protein HYV15_05935, partial [Elusimicrobia bacterium]|nr:hypothetical protein [Elusimicrobiota bacterium]
MSPDGGPGKEQDQDINDVLADLDGILQDITSGAAKPPPADAAARAAAEEAARRAAEAKRQAGEARRLAEQREAEAALLKAQRDT